MQDIKTFTISGYWINDREPIEGYTVAVGEFDENNTDPAYKAFDDTIFFWFEREEDVKPGDVNGEFVITQVSH